VTAIVLTTVVAVAVAVPLVATSTPQFFSRYHLLERRYVNLEESAHEGIGCRSCHQTAAIRNGLSLIGDFYVSLVRTDKTPEFFTFQPPRREACLSCHEGDWVSDSEQLARIPHPAHQSVAAETRECVECHKWTAHLESYMAEHEQMPFSGICVAYGCHVGTKQSDECFDCHHVLRQSGEEWTTEHPKVVQVVGDNGCLEQCHEVSQCQQCHTTGERPDFSNLSFEEGVKAIEELHVKPEWVTTYHGAEALKDKSQCLRCHQSEGECDECHLQRPAFHGSTDTWIGRHSKQTDSIDDPRCLTCHEKPWCEDCHEQFKEMG